MHEIEFTSILTFFHTLAYEGHFNQREQLLKYLRAVFISRHCLRMHISFANLIIVVGEQII